MVKKKQHNFSILAVVFSYFNNDKTVLGPSRGLGDLGRMAIYFQGAGSTGHYFREAMGASS